MDKKIKYQMPLRFGGNASTSMASNTEYEKIKADKQKLLTNTAMLVRLEIGLPGQTKKDNDATDVVHKHFSASTEAGGYAKKLYAKRYMAEITSIVSATRLFFRKTTLPWRGKSRLLPSKAYMDFLSDMNAHKSNFKTARDRFKASWADIHTEASARLGTMYKRSVYPHLLELDNEFVFELDIEPIPKGEDLDLRDVMADELEILKERLDKANEKDFERGTTDLWFRLYDVVNAMQKKMSNKDAKAYHGTIITNVEELVDILGVLNIMEDPELERLGSEVKGRLCAHDINEIKKSEDLREDIASEASGLMNQIINVSGIDVNARGKIQ